MNTPIVRTKYALSQLFGVSYSAVGYYIKPTIEGGQFLSPCPKRTRYGYVIGSPSSPKYDLEMALVDYRANGYTIRRIAKSIGMSTESFHDICKNTGVKI